MLSFIKKLLKIKEYADNFIAWASGKKTVTGLITLGIWTLIYAVPAMFPEYPIIAEVGLHIRDFLANAGLDLSSALLDLGANVTVIGLIDKVRKLLLAIREARQLKAAKVKTKARTRAGVKVTRPKKK